MFEAISVAEFEERTNLLTQGTSQWNTATHIVSLRQLVTVEALEPMRRDYLEQLMQSITLAGADRTPVYCRSSVETMRIDPQSIVLGQTFVERGKYQRFLETFNSLFSSFCVPRGVAKLSACVALGKTHDGAYAIAHYIPPIVERNAGELTLLDGVHRMFLGKQIGTTIECVVVSPHVPFPADVHGWDRVSVVSEKPALNDRYSNLRPELFRDLKYVGVDG
jgi:hypothetical protein